MATLQTLSFSGELLQRGFWLYVCEIETGVGRRLLYVGRTGDSSSANASSPLNRMGQHLGFNKHANALRRQLARAGIEAESCRRFEMTAYGPLFAEGNSVEEHRALRDKIAPLEKALCDGLHRAGYTVLNTVSSRKPLDHSLWEQARQVFAAHFLRLNAE